MLVLSAEATAEVTIKRSRFIGELTYAATQDEARGLLRAKKESWSLQGITHLVHAFIIGPGANIMGCSDDGEPAGTAGRPTLEVLKGSGITNVLLTTARFFGGIKLGTGGLVKAYTEIAQLVIANAVTTELVPKKEFKLVFPYQFYDRIRIVLAENMATTLTEDFSDAVTIAANIPEQHFVHFVEMIRDLTHAQVIVEVMGE